MLSIEDFFFCPLHEHKHLHLENHIQKMNRIHQQYSVHLHIPSKYSMHLIPALHIIFETEVASPCFSALELGHLEVLWKAD